MPTRQQEKIGGQDNSIVVNIPKTFFLDRILEEIRQSYADKDRVITASYLEMVQDEAEAVKLGRLKDAVLYSLGRRSF